MSQHDFEIANQGFPATRADLNNALQALASVSAGTSEPSTTYAYQFWYDETNDLLKMRNSDNDAFITLAAFDQTNDEWEVRSAVIQAVDSAGVSIKTDDGTTRVSIADDGSVTINTSLDVDNINIDGNTISSTDTNGDINITPDGSGKVVLDGLNYPTADGTDGQVLTTDGSGNIAFEDAPSGKVLQVVSTIKTDTFSEATVVGEIVDVTGLTATITPSSASNKILIMVSVSVASDRNGGSGESTRLHILRGGSVIPEARGDASGTRQRDLGGMAQSGDGRVAPTLSYTYLDSPSSTSALTYAVGVGCSSNETVFVNRADDDADSNTRSRMASTITVMEIAG